MDNESLISTRLLFARQFVRLALTTGYLHLSLLHPGLVIITEDTIQLKLEEFSLSLASDKSVEEISSNSLTLIEDLIDLPVPET